MGKKDKSINPADAHRRAQHKKEVKKNKLERKKLRDQLLLQKDPTKIAADIAKYTRLDEEGRLDAAGKQKLQRLIAGKQKIEEARKEETKTSKSAEESSKLPKDPTRSVHYHPTLNPYGIPPPGQAYQEIEGSNDRFENQDENGSKNEGSENSSQSDSDSLSDSEDSDKNEVVSDTGIELPDEGPESTLKNSDNIGEKDESNGDILIQSNSCSNAKRI
ncbi:hypothetical protein DSO57_1023975 [Entomophthora muscae]|uniref:Uncharacterized protein n=1 Tax=Entomophthora muscae TaxID=34485 RepID=A0ACC2RTT2_9FUNG|nr:hypothetical protein DSO57_1023975 [Entomophthora muscae]